MPRADASTRLPAMRGLDALPEAMEFAPTPSSGLLKSVEAPGLALKVGQQARSRPRELTSSWTANQSFFSLMVAGAPPWPGLGSVGLR